MGLDPQGPGSKRRGQIELEREVFIIMRPSSHETGFTVLARTWKIVFVS